ENPRALARAFVPRRIRSETDAGRRIALLKSIADFGEEGVVEDAVSPGEWRENGEAHLDISGYRAQELDLDVDARGETLVATSIPAWPGWKASLDGRRIDTVFYNHAFVGFRVAEGRHRVRLRYLPDGFVSGAGISGATLLLCVALMLRPSRARTSPPA
ncbi:MAG: YfhO family protein, partial [Acidobacteriota bacterium]